MKGLTIAVTAHYDRVSNTKPTTYKIYGAITYDNVKNKPGKQGHKRYTPTRNFLRKQEFKNKIRKKKHRKINIIERKKKIKT